jgi:hypothetical protein
MASRKDITLRKNASFRLDTQWLNQDGSAKDLTGCSVKMQIRNEPGGSSLHGTWTVGSGFTLDAANGTFALLIPQATISAYDFTSAAYDIVVTWPDTSKDTVLYGLVALEKGVTL